MSNTTRSLWAGSVFAVVLLLTFACSSDTVGEQGQELGPGRGMVSGATGAMQDAASSVGGAAGTAGSTAATGDEASGPSSSASTDSGVTTTSPASTGTTGGQTVGSSGEVGTSAAGGTSGIDPGLTTTSSAGGVSNASQSSLSSGAGGGSSVQDDPECEAFCDLFFEVCGDEVGDSFFADQLYPDHANCMTACVTFEKGGSYGSDTLGCRRAHIVDNPDGGVHCMHASESGGGQCPPEQ